ETPRLAYPESLRRRLRSAVLEPIDAFAHQVELERIAARALRTGNLDRDVEHRAGGQRLGQPCAGEGAIADRSRCVAELRTETHETTAVGSLRRKRPGRQIVDARPHL